jgi:ribonuclease J
MSLDNNENENKNRNQQPAEGEPRPQRSGQRRRRRRPNTSETAQATQEQPQAESTQQSGRPPRTGGQGQRRQQQPQEQQAAAPTDEAAPASGAPKRRRRRRPNKSQGEQQAQAQPQAVQADSDPSSGKGGGQRRQQRGQGQPQENPNTRGQQPARTGERSGRAQQSDVNQERSAANRTPRVRRPRREEEVLERRPVHQRGAAHHGHAVLGPIGTDTLRVIPLGGVGEVGKNMTAVECGNDVLLLDAGGKFPEEEQRGIDLIIPDISFVMDRMRNFRGILITHGHEDHIGGLPYIIPQIISRNGGKKVPIYATPLALGFIERKLLEARLDDKVELHQVKGGSRVQLGSIEAEFIHVTHSIPDACAIALHTPVGTIVDTGDFKFDPTPVMGGPTDERRLRRIGDDGVLALFSDTVRVENSGSTPSEKVVHEKLDEEIASAKGQVIIATFASNVSRIYMALKAAEKHGRKVAVAGRSMEQNARVAMDLGYLDPPEGLFVPLDDLLRMPKEKRVIVSTGSQGEAAAALARIAAGEHPKIRVSRGDKIIVSATPIPGNDDTVSNTINNLYRLGVDVVYSALDRGVHVSGHAGRDELRRMIDLLKPSYTVPIHGEFRHMALYRELSVEAGIKRDHVLLPEIGGVLEFTKKGANQRGRVKSGNILVDRLGDRGNPLTVLRTRENLTDDGFVVVTMIVDRVSGDLVAGPYLIGKGLAKDLNNGALKEAENELKRMLGRRKEGATQLGYAVARAKETVGKVLYRRSKTRPLILPIVTEL